VDLPSGDRVDLVWHALADATRRDIVEVAIRSELSVSALARRYPISLAAVQKHVAVPDAAGLVHKRREGRERLVSADIRAVHDAGQLLDRLEAVWRDRLDRFSGVIDQQSKGDTT
jgi:DNA-binding transcriptional ArsR family regulator